MTNNTDTTISNAATGASKAVSNVNLKVKTPETSIPPVQFVGGNPTVFLPSKSMFSKDDNTLKLKITGQYTASIRSNMRSIDDDGNSNVISYDSQRIKAIFYFIAPNELTEVVSHSYKPYESVASKLAEKAGVGGKVATEWNNLGTTLQQTTIAGLEAIAGGKNKTPTDKKPNTSTTNGNWTEPLSRLLSQGTKALQGSDVYLYRTDSPLVYEGSQRRIYEFIFQLFATGDGIGYGGNTAYDEVIWPVKLLQYMSSPTLPSTKDGTAIAEVRSPAIFSINTEPAGLLSVERAVLKQINPVYRGPYINGAPTSCELHLTFEEFDPLWDKVFIPSGLVTTSSTPKTAL